MKAAICIVPITSRINVFMGIILTLILFIPQATHATEWNYREQSKIQWREYGDAAFAEAKAMNKPLYVLIYANWCHWCKKFETKTLETELIRNLLQEKMIPVAVDNVEQPEIGQKLGAKLVPTSVILTPDGQRLLRFYGFLSADELDEALRRTLLRWRKGELPEEEFGDESTCCPVR
jgi:thioredoxin-like negative regulator of GroEL